MSEHLLDEFRLGVVDGLQSHSLTTCSRWASRRRVMGGDFSGLYSYKYHPWCKEMHDSWAPMNWAMKGAQLGVTEVCINRALYTLDILKRDVLYVLPTAKGASDFSKSRFNVALAMSPYLNAIFSDANSVEMKQAGNNTLYIRGSGGKSNLVSIPVSELILDEVDRMETKQIWLALERLSGQLEANRHVWGISTPTLPDHGIHLQYKESTQEHFMFPCPSCGKTIELKWPESVVVVGEHVGDPRCNESHLICYECKAKLPHEAKPDFLSKAHWESLNKNANKNVRGFHISQLYSYTITPGNLVESFLRGHGDELAAKEFFNSKLGLPYISEGARVGEDMILRAINGPSRIPGGHSKHDARPERAGRIITMGIDRGKWNYAEVIEWFMDKWTFDINASAVGKVLYETKFLEEHFDQTLDQLMSEWQVLACVLDADPGPMEARRFARRYPGFVWLCRYRKGRQGKEISISEDETGAPMATVDRSHWMSASLGRFKANPTRITLPYDISDEYQNHVKEPAASYERDDMGNPTLVYISTKPDHFAHARTYSEIALPLVASQQMNADIRRFN